MPDDIAPVCDANGAVVGHAQLIDDQMVIHLTSPAIAAWVSSSARRLTINIEPFVQEPHDPGEEIQRGVERDSAMIHKDGDTERNPWDDATDADRALEFIRRAAWVHYLGQAFDPEHMRDISQLAADALCGTPIPAPTPWKKIEASADAHWKRVRELVDDDGA